MGFVLRIAGIALVFAGSFYGVVYACTCGGINTPAAEYESNDAVFLGTVTSIMVDTANRDLFVTFTVVESWKGVPGDTISVFTPMDGTACGYPFEPGESYLVYAVHWSPYSLITSSCSRTRLLLYAADDLAFLGTVNSVPPPSGGREFQRIELKSISNYPNPTITIQYALPTTASIVISLYSISGQLVQTLHNGVSRVGVSEVNVDISRLSTGIYIATLRSEYGVGMTKLSIIR